MSLSKIPNDIIINEILPYTYCPQPKNLLEDIKNYYNTRKYLFEKYYNMYGRDDYIKDSMDYDLIRFFNEDISLADGFLNCFYRRYKRLFKLKEKKNEYVRHVMSQMGGQGRNAVTLDIGIKLGILRTFERDQFIRFVDDYYCTTNRWYGVWYDGGYVGNIYHLYPQLEPH